METIPAEVFTEIFIHLPPVDLLLFAQTSRAINRLVAVFYKPACPLLLCKWRKAVCNCGENEPDYACDCMAMEEELFDLLHGGEHFILRLWREQVFVQRHDQDVTELRVTTEANEKSYYVNSTQWELQGKLGSAWYCLDDEWFNCNDSICVFLLMRDSVLREEMHTPSAAFKRILLKTLDFTVVD
jgi:hypothetical protein